jgi:hypothetical protein
LVVESEPVSDAIDYPCPDNIPFNSHPISADVLAQMYPQIASKLRWWRWTMTYENQEWFIWGKYGGNRGRYWCQKCEIELRLKISVDEA